MTGTLFLPPLIPRIDEQSTLLLLIHWTRPVPPAPVWTNCGYLKMIGTITSLEEEPKSIP